MAETLTSRFGVDKNCRSPIKMSPVCQLEMTLPGDYPGGVQGDGSADERWGTYVRRAIAGTKTPSSGSIGSRGCQGPLDVGSGSGQALRSGRVLRSFLRCVCTASEEVRDAIGLGHGVDLRSPGRSLTGRANAATVAPVFIW